MTQADLYIRKEKKKKKRKYHVETNMYLYGKTVSQVVWHFLCKYMHASAYNQFIVPFILKESSIFDSFISILWDNMIIFNDRNTRSLRILKNMDCLREDTTKFNENFWPLNLILKYTNLVWFFLALIITAKRSLISIRAGLFIMMITFFIYSKIVYLNVGTTNFFLL